MSHSWPAKTLVLPLVAFAILYNTPKFFELQVIVPGDDLNGTIAEKYDIAATDLRLNGYYYKIYLMWMNFLLMGLGPFVVLVVLNALSVRELIVLSGGNNITIGPDSATNRRKDIVLAKVSMAIVFVFIVCHSIKWIPNIYELLQVSSIDVISKALLMRTREILRMQATISSGWSSGDGIFVISSPPPSLPRKSDCIYLSFITLLITLMHCR